VFTRERLNGYYGVTAFVLSNSLSSLPFLFLISLLSALIGYWLIKLQNDFERFVYFVLMLFSSLAGECRCFLRFFLDPSRSFPSVHPFSYHSQLLRGLSILLTLHISKTCHEQNVL
jgi:hypothetical protein